MWTLTLLLFLSLILGFGAWLFFLWSVKSGHYDDIERPKHRMLDDDGPPPADPRGPNSAGRQNDLPRDGNRV
jgi:cbb3-type cytochrome oxidase maturation protein